MAAAQAPLGLDDGAQSAHGLDSRVHAMAHVQPHGLIRRPRIGARQHFRQFLVEAGRLNNRVGGEIVEPIENQHVVALDQLLQLDAARVLGNAHVQLKMVAVHRKGEIRIAVTGG
ncbi:MAG: hypothetical protein DMG08_16305 [Acidobacteria bacterium]|nr:MAG: hypothetical protein DMG08_16305 [Acidobacteriota bacterium]